MNTSVIRKVSFNSAHRLHNPKWDEKKNNEVFGLCNNPNYHGHNYELHVKVTGTIDPETGYVIDLKILNDVLQEEIVERFDHRNINLDIPEFKNLNSTAENIAKVIYDLLKPKLDPQLKVQITLYETPRNYVIYPD
jgi:6-pyruvoyltetrahydropterin/6-carboxytetrahydropterin synthase